jgi:hypothetical protein
MDAGMHALDAKILGLELRILEQFAKLHVARLRDKIWWLVITGTVLGVMARGFKWI